MGLGLTKHLVNVLHVSQVCYAIPTEETSMASFSYKCHQLKIWQKKVPFLPKRLPCEKVELMLQRHRRHPWCMWSGCQRSHFLLSGLKWTGQTQILAQQGLHASPRWSQRSYQSLAFLYESLWEESQGSPLHSVWKWAPSSLSSRSQASAKIRVQYMRKREHLQKWIRNATKVYKSHKGNKHIINIISNYTILWDWDWQTFGECTARQSGVLCNPHRGDINGFLQLQVSSTQNLTKKKSLSCQNASLARKWSWCFNGIVVIHGVCGRVASARISCFRASSGLAKHRYWPNRGLHASPRWSQRSYQSLAFLYESLWEESQGSPLHSVWKWAPSSLSSRSQASAKIRVHEEKRTSPEMDQKCHKSTWISLGT